MNSWRRAGIAVLAGLVTGAGALAVFTTPVRLVPGAGAWPRCVGGLHADGRLDAAGTVFIPGVDRGVVRGLVFETEGAGNLGVAADRGALQWVRAGAQPTLLTLPATRVPGVHLSLRSDPPRSLRITAIEVRSDGARPWLAGALLALTAAGLAFVLPWTAAPRLALGWSLLAAGLIVAAASPLLLLWSLPSAPALWRVLLPATLVAAGLALGMTSGLRRRFLLGAALLAAAVFGAWVRAYFLPSAGSWDVDYWKACALRTTAHGVTRAYGDPESTPPGHFLAQMRGQEPAWELAAFGRTFVIDQPPGIQWLWKTSWQLIARAGVWTQDEGLNAAAKLPTIAGDLLTVGVLLWAFGWTRRGLVLAALFWAFPISWLPGAVLGFFDGTYVPLVLASLVMAGRGRAVWAGVLLALAALVKSLALLMAPAVAVALWKARAPLGRAFVAGGLVGVAALLPFALAGTLPTAVVHMYRILFQLRLSGGYANGWWILGHLLSLDSRAFTEAIPFVRIEAVPFPVRPIGTALFAMVAVWVARAQLRAAGPLAAALAAATLVLAYGQVAIGIHENHPHAFAPALLATGLMTRRLRVLAAVFLSTYVLNMLALSGIGRFYGVRHLAVDSLSRWAGQVRMAPGFDLTLLLAVVNLAAFVWLLVVLPREMEAAASGGQDAQAGQP